MQYLVIIRKEDNNSIQKEVTEDAFKIRYLHHGWISVGLHAVEDSAINGLPKGDK